MKAFFTTGLAAIILLSGGSAILAADQYIHCRTDRLPDRTVHYQFTNCEVNGHLTHVSYRFDREPEANPADKAVKDTQPPQNRADETRKARAMRNLEGERKRLIDRLTQCQTSECIYQFTKDVESLESELMSYLVKEMKQ